MLHLWGKIIKKKIQLVFAVNGFMYRQNYKKQSHKQYKQYA